MATGDNTVTIEGFVTDAAFIDQTKAINDILVGGAGRVASLTPTVLSYFTTPAAFNDRRTISSRVINWTAATSPQMVIDEHVFQTFVNTVNAQVGGAPVGFFKLIDKLFFNYNASVSHTTLETALLADTDIAAIYVPGSFSLSSVVKASTVHLTGTTTQAVSVPAYVNFSITLPSGSSTVTFVMRLYTSVDDWLSGYNSSTIVEVIPPLTYDKLLSSSLVATNANIFTTASSTATLSYTNAQPALAASPVTGMVEYQVALTDGTNSVAVPFNILYKGRPPTTFEIRNAIKNEFLTSGFGNTTTWHNRAPGVFVSGRFYVVPMWDATYTKPDQTIFPNIALYTSYATKANQILASLGYGDVSSYMDLLIAYYNHMSCVAIPDLSGNVDVVNLVSLIPDYQNYSSTDTQFGYMAPLTQSFVHDLNVILSVEDGATTTNAYTLQSEGALGFYTFTVGNYEICVITKASFNTILESTQ